MSWSKLRGKNWVGHINRSPLPTRAITKRYHADGPLTGTGRQLALRIDDALYYTLTDPTGLSLTLIDAQGHEAGHVLYSPLGGGRFYDPSLGRPLQPNPAAGPPCVPKALNRYAATSAGQVGVAQGVATGGHNWLFDIFSIAKGAAFDIAAVYPVLSGYKYIGQIDVVLQASRSALTRKIPRAFRSSFGDLTPTGTDTIFEKTGRLLVGGSTERELTLATRQLENFLMDALPGQGRWKANVLLSEVIMADQLPQYVKVGNLPEFKALKLELGPALDVGIGGYLQYLEDRNSPYLTPGQKGLRVITAGVGGAGTALLIGEGLVALGCSATVVCGIAAGVTGVIVWSVAQPIVFDFPVFAPADRNLRPLQVP